MILELRAYNFGNGDAKLLVKNSKKLNRLGMVKEVNRFYERHPYAKMVDEEWICGDYRIDQQRPVRNVYSEQYIKIVQITKMERKWLNGLVKGIEENIDYPLICPNCESENIKDSNYCIYCGAKL